jgi:hypothetical protein
MTNNDGSAPPPKTRLANGAYAPHMESVIGNGSAGAGG